MKAFPQPVAEMVGKLIARFGSDSEGEIIATRNALARKLASAGLDFNDAAERFIAPSLPEPVFPRSQPAPPPRPQGWPGTYDWRRTWRPNIDPLRDVRDRIARCRSAEPDLSAWEREFLASLGRRVCDGFSLSPKQAGVLDGIAAKLGERP